MRNKVLPENQQHIQRTMNLDHLGSFHFLQTLEIFLLHLFPKAKGKSLNMKFHQQRFHCDLLLEEFQKCSGEVQLQYLIYFSTDSGYPDYFSKYLVDHLKIVDPKVKIILNCVGDGIYKVKEVITPSS